MIMIMTTMGANNSDNDNDGSLMIVIMMGVNDSDNDNDGRY